MEKELVFISWSGLRSKAVAQALYDWLPKIIQAVDPWMSESDIDKGTRWDPEITRHLEKAHFGLICLTPENLSAPWILFETGALSKSLEKARIWTYLLNVNYTDIEWPLAQFQHTRAETEETRKLVHAINRALGGAVRETHLNELFNNFWSDFERCLKDIPDTQEKSEPQRDEREILTEILELVRYQARAYPKLPPFAQSSVGFEFISKCATLEQALLSEYKSMYPTSFDYEGSHLNLPFPLDLREKGIMLNTLLDELTGHFSL